MFGLFARLAILPGTGEMRRNAGMHRNVRERSGKVIEKVDDNTELNIKDKHDFEETKNLIKEALKNIGG